MLSQESKLSPKTIDSTYLKVPLAADDLKDFFLYEWAVRIDSGLLKELHIHNKGWLSNRVCNLVLDQAQTKLASLLLLSFCENCLIFVSNHFIMYGGGKLSSSYHNYLEVNPTSITSHKVISCSFSFLHPIGWEVMCISTTITSRLSLSGAESWLASMQTHKKFKFFLSHLMSLAFHV